MNMFSLVLASIGFILGVGALCSTFRTGIYISNQNRLIKELELCEELDTLELLD